MPREVAYAVEKPLRIGFQVVIDQRDTRRRRMSAPCAHIGFRFALPSRSPRYGLHALEIHLVKTLLPQQGVVRVGALEQACETNILSWQLGILRDTLARGARRKVHRA